MIGINLAKAYCLRKDVESYSEKKAIVFHPYGQRLD